MLGKVYWTLERMLVWMLDLMLDRMPDWMSD